MSDEWSLFKVLLRRPYDETTITTYTKGKSVAEVTERVNQFLEAVEKEGDEVPDTERALAWAEDCYLAGVEELGEYDEFEV